MRNLKFNLNIDSSALLCPNPQEFYSKAYITEDVADNFRTLPGIKTSTKIARTSFSSILKDSSCDFVAGDQTLDAITIDVTPVSALAELCRYDLESSFISASMSKGSNASFEVQPFMSYYFDELAKEVQSEISQIRFKGDTANVAFTGATAFLKLADGYEKILANDSTVLDVAKTGITTANVLAEVAKVFKKMADNKPEVLAQPEKLRLHMASDVAFAYKQAVAAGNTLSYVTQNLALTYLDIKIVINPGMTAGTMILGPKDNFIYAFDGEGDSKQIKAINLEETVAEPKLRSRINLKLGFNVVNGGEIVYYS